MKTEKSVLLQKLKDLETKEKDDQVKLQHFKDNEMAQKAKTEKKQEIKAASKPAAVVS